MSSGRNLKIAWRGSTIPAAKGGHGLWLIGLGLVLLVTVGCGKKEPTMGILTGTITIDGQPPEKGSIAFFPTDGKSKTTGTKIQQGEYSAQVPLGEAEVQIRVSKVVGEKKDTPNGPAHQIRRETLPAKYNSRTELLIDIQPGTNRKDFELSTK